MPTANLGPKIGEPRRVRSGLPLLVLVELKERISETAEVFCNMTDRELKDAPPTDEWQIWLYSVFYVSDRQRRLEILKNWDGRRHRDGIWARHQRELEEVNWMLECRGR
jgi:hypothetical protein